MSYKILIIDDEASQFKKYEDVLQPYKELQLIHANNGPDAVAEIQNNPPDLIFLDQVFNAENVEIIKLYGVDITGKIGEHKEGTNPEDIKKDELKQGLYILKMIRNLGRYIERKIPIIFVTQYVDTTGNAWSEAQKNGAQNYISKDRITREMLIPLIERYLCIKLITTDEAINNLVNIYIKGNPKDERETFVKCLSNEAIKHRRRGIPFIEAVLKKLPQSAPTLSDLSETIKEVGEEEIWKSEPVNPQEILRWVLAKVTNNMLPKEEKAWNYVGHNVLRYTFKTAKNGKHYLLKIVHPRYSKEVVSFKSENKYQGILPVLFCSSFKLEKNDPDWEGTHVVVYLEEAIDAKTIREYVEDINLIYPLDSTKIKNILSNLKNNLKNISPTGHGMIDMDSIYIKDDASVWIADLLLWEFVNNENLEMIKGLTLRERDKRDIQSLGIAADILLTGYPGGLESMPDLGGFNDFLLKCASGCWNLESEIKVPPVKARFIHCGSFASNLERKFFYKLKSAILKKNAESYIFLNARIQLKSGIPNDVDALVVLMNKIVWIDVKGKKYYDGTSKLPIRVTDLIAQLSKLSNVQICLPVESYLVMDKDELALLNKEGSLTPADRNYVFDFDTFLDEKLFSINQTITAQYRNFKTVYDILRSIILSSTESVYEKTQEFRNAYGNVIRQVKGNEYDELLTDRYYIRRYCVGHVTDPYLEIDGIRLLIERARNENLIMDQLQSSYLLLPIVVIAVNTDNRQIELNTALSNSPEAASIRWLYKIYSRPNEGSECPLSIKERVNNISEIEKEKLFYHYLKAVDALLKIKDRFQFGFDEYSLKIFEINNRYTGVIEPKLGMEIDQRSIVTIFDMLSNSGNMLQSYREELVNASATLKSAVEMLIDKLSQHHEKEDYLGKIKNDIKEIMDDVKTLKTSKEIITIQANVKKIQNDVETLKTNKQIMTIRNYVEKIKRDIEILKNSQFISNRPQQSQDLQTYKESKISSTQETTPVGKFQNHQEKKVEAESISIKPPEKQTQGRLEGTIKLLAFSVDFNSVNEEKRREQFRCDFINNIKNGQLVKIGYPKQSSGVYSGMIWILNEQQHNTAKDVQVVTIASEPIMEYGSIEFQGKGYMFRKDAISPEDLKGLHEGGKVSFILNKGDIVKDIKIIPS